MDTIEGNGFTVSIAHRGAEIKSLVWRGLPLLWNDRTLPGTDHAWWKLSAPILFPIVGGLQQGQSRLADGRLVRLPYHGFADICDFRREAIESGSHGAVVRYVLDTEMVAASLGAGVDWPFPCAIVLEYRLEPKGLRLAVRVENRGSETMYFQFGWHPGLRVPALPAGNPWQLSQKRQARIAIPRGRHTLWQTNRASELTGERQERSSDGSFSHDEAGLDYTYVVDLERMRHRFVCLEDPVAGLRHRLDFDDLPHLGIWSDPGAPFICLEPWQGCDDWAAQSPFEDRFGTRSLDAAEVWECAIHYQVEAIGKD